MSEKVRIKIKEIEGPIDGAPPWITTFVDMISLLVTFFILLFTFSSIREYDAFTFRSNITGTAGTFEGEAKTDMEAPADDLMMAYDLERGSRVPHSRPTDQLLENIEEMGQKLTQEHIQFDPQHIGNGLTIRFGERAGFSPGSTRVNSVLARALGEFGRTMQHYTLTIVVEGFTDSAFKPTPRYPTAEALSLARAREAAEVMLKGSGLPAELVQIAGLGTRRRRSDLAQDTAMGRRADRRVEVRIVALDSARASISETKPTKDRR